MFNPAYNYYRPMQLPYYRQPVPQMAYPSVFSQPYMPQPAYQPQTFTSRLATIRQPQLNYAASIPVRQSTYFPQQFQSPQKLLASPLRQSYGPNHLMFSPQRGVPQLMSPDRSAPPQPQFQSPQAQKQPPMQPQVRPQQPQYQQPQYQQPPQFQPRPQQQVPPQYQQPPQPQKPQPQFPQKQPQPQQPQQQKGKPQKQQPQQPQSGKKDEDLEKRFAEAIQRTKKIVDKYNNDPSASSQAPQKKNQVPEPIEINQMPERGLDQQPDKDNKQEEEPEELALQYEDGYIYRGQGVPPQTRHGFGVLTDAENQEVYAGFWEDNLYHGEGRLNNLEQEELEGPLDWNNMTSISNGWSGYEGEFANGKMHGKGTLYLTNGEKYEGEFQDGMVHGQGEFTTQDGNVVKGIWENGYLVQLQE